MQVNIHAAKSQLSKLIARAELGDEVVIARAGKPVVKIVPVSARKLVSGLAKGKVWMSPDFTAPMSEKELKEFLGG
jgi:prevent-host-death family protein